MTKLRDTPKPAVEVWLIALDSVTPLLLADDWPASSSVARISAALPERPVGADAWFQRRRAAHMALRLILAQRIGIDAAAAPFVIGAHGKPELFSQGRRFSLSHSGSRALVGVSTGAEIGVDIEAPRTPQLSSRRRADIIAAGIALAGGLALGGSMEDQQFLQAWVRLEAIAKCSGRGMGRLLGELGIIGGGDRSGGAGGRMDNQHAVVRDITLDQCYRAAVAGRVADWSGDISRFPEDRPAIEHFVPIPA